MSENQILKQINENVDNCNDLLETIYRELTRTGAATIKGLLQSLENRGTWLENTAFPKLHSQLLDIEKAILASALITANPQNPEKILEKAYKTVEEFLNNQTKQ